MRTPCVDASIWPQPVYEDHGTGKAVWAQIGGSDEAAVSPDCPYLAHGPDGKLSDCQESCAASSSCNLINWSPSIPDCVLRVCDNPSNPTLSPTTGYTVYGITNKADGTLTVNPLNFSFTAIGFNDDVLLSALARYRAITFMYGSGTPVPQGPSGSFVSALLVNVTTSDDVLREDTDESYSLHVEGNNGDGSPASVLTAATVFGALRGLETFSQVMQYNLTGKTYQIKSTDIWDAPRFPFRGVLVDTSRRFMPLSVLKSVIDMMSYLKLNALVPHFNDDQSWSLEIEGWPRLAGQGAYSNTSHTYSHADIRELVAYARMRGVRLIPEFDSPSHTGTIEHAYKEMTALAYDSDKNPFACLLDVSKVSF